LDNGQRVSERGKFRRVGSEKPGACGENLESLNPGRPCHINSMYVELFDDIDIDLKRGELWES